MNFNPKPGDCVTLREWDDMAEEFGLNKHGEIETPLLHIFPGMKQYCGQSFIVSTVYYESSGRTYRFRGNPYYFPFCALVGSSSSTSQSPLPPPSISFDSLLQPLTNP